MTSQLAREAQETLIRFDEADPTAYVYTASRRVRDVLLKAGLKPVKSEPDGWFFEVPKQAVRLKPGRRAVLVGGTQRPSRIDATRRQTPPRRSRGET